VKADQPFLTEEAQKLEDNPPTKLGQKKFTITRCKNF
jgi:hypothetical protein